MAVKLTDDEVAAIGTLSGGWSWGLITVPEEETATAVAKGIGSLMVRGLVTEEGVAGEIVKISTFSGSTHTVASASVTEDGIPSRPVLQVLLIQHGEEDEGWLLDVCSPEGIHRMEFLDDASASDYLQQLCGAYAAARPEDQEDNLALLSIRDGEYDGILINGSVLRAVREGDKVEGIEVLAADSGKADWSKLVATLL